MSEYLSRLVTRAQIAGEARSPRPFVRSTSPITERDQRIGMPGFEGFELSAATPAEAAGLEAEPQQGVASEPAPRAEVTATGGAGEGTVQKKIARPAASSASQAASRSPSLRSAAGKATDRIEPFASNITDVDTAERSEARLDLSLPSSSPVIGAHRLPDSASAVSGSQSIFPENHIVADSEQPVSPEGVTESEIPGADRSQARRVTPQFSRGSVRTRSVWQMRELDSALLEPSARVFAEHVEPPPMAASVFAAESSESPRVVIGRVDVQVVSPPAPQTQAPTRPGPVTAESVSVIGPLSSGARPGLHFSLRHK